MAFLFYYYSSKTPSEDPDTVLKKLKGAYLLKSNGIGAHLQSNCVLETRNEELVFIDILDGFGMLTRRRRKPLACKVFLSTTKTHILIKIHLRLIELLMPVFLFLSTVFIMFLIIGSTGLLSPYAFIPVYIFLGISFIYGLRVVNKMKFFKSILSEI